MNQKENTIKKLRIVNFVILVIAIILTLVGSILILTDKYASTGYGYSRMSTDPMAGVMTALGTAVFIIGIVFLLSSNRSPYLIIGTLVSIALAQGLVFASTAFKIDSEMATKGYVVAISGALISNIVLILSIISVIFLSLSDKKRNKKQPEKRIEETFSLTNAQNMIAPLKELKKLLEVEVFTKEEFEREKAALFMQNGVNR